MSDVWEARFLTAACGAGAGTLILLVTGTPPAHLALFAVIAFVVSLTIAVSAIH